jgi:cell division protein FtsB
MLVLVLLLVALQYRLWFGEGSMEQVVYLEREVEKQRAENAKLQERNRILEAQIQELRQGLEGIEKKAREEMGMIKQGETFYLIVDEEAQQSP